MNNTKTIILDNFFDNPDSVRGMALSLDYRKRTSTEFFEGVRSEHLHKVSPDFYNSVCSRIIIEYYGENNYAYEASVFFHKTEASDKADIQWLTDKVHTDDLAIITGIVYLTPNAPISAGTQTYQKTSEGYIPDIVMGNRYNRLILYPAKTPHSAMDLFGNNYDCRLVMLFFLERISAV
jgi:hypothetical protein